MSAFVPDDSAVPPLRIQIGAELTIIDRMAPRFNIPLTISLASLAVTLVAAAALQVSFGLRPMSRPRRALGATGSGRADKLPGDFPSEVQPLVDDLNNLFRCRARSGTFDTAMSRLVVGGASIGAFCVSQYQAW
jgi:hypothetical protein